MSHRPGGGLGSRVVTSKPVKTGVGARGLDKRWASQIGQSMGNHISGLEGGSKTLKGIRATPYKGPNFDPVKQGNEIAAATVCGPGGSRNVYRTGVQGQHGSVDRGGSRIANTKGQWPDSK